MMQTFNPEDNIHKAWLYRVLESIADDAYLSQVLYFKGGTCASMLGWLDRFSVDLDFDYAGEIDDVPKTRKALEKIFIELGLSVKDSSKNGIQYFLKYENEQKNNQGRNTLKVDASFPLFKSSKYSPESFVEINRVMKCQTIETMFAHKLCALTDRFEKTGHIAGRDLYDIHHFFMQGYKYEPSIITDRTGLDSKDYLEKLIDFIEINVTDRIITEDLSALISADKFKVLRKVLKREMIQFIKIENMNNIPRISVTVPALNEEETIPKLLESFRNQTRKDFEVIIVDNSSTDETRNIVLEEIKRRSFNLKLLTEDKKGVGFSRRKGMDDASSRSIPFLAGTDADSIVPNNWIEVIGKGFDDTNADCLFGLARHDWSPFKIRPELYYIIDKVWTVRDAFVSNIEIPPRGVNFAITNEMYKKVGGMPQPKNEEGRPMPGEDIQLKKLVEGEGGKIASINSDVLTSSRRVLRALIKNAPNDYYKDFEDIRGEAELLHSVLKLDKEVFEKFADATLRRFFLSYIVNQIDTPVWKKVEKFIEPENVRFLSDARTLAPEELYDKYCNIFTANAKKIGSKVSGL